MIAFFNAEFLKIQLFGAVIPATICAAIVLIFSRPWRENIHSLHKNAYWSMALGLAAGYTFAYWAITGEIPSFPVDVEEYDSDSWLIYISFILTTFAFIHSFVNNNASKGIFVLVSALVTAILIVPEWIVDEGESKALLWYWRTAYVVLSVGLFAIFEKLTDVTKGRTFSLLCFFLFTAASGVLVFSANAKMGQLCGTVAAMSMAMFVLSFMFSNINWGSNGVYFLAIVLPALLINGYLSSDIPMIPFILVAVSPIFAWCAQLKFIQKYPPIVISAMHIVAVLIPNIIALFIAHQYYV